MNLSAEARRVQTIASHIQSLEQSLVREKQMLAEVSLRLTASLEARDVLQHCAQTIQQQVHKRIADVVTVCLQTVFDNPYTFRIEFERKRGRTEAKLRFMRGSLDVDPMTASGGGMIDVAAFALRVACLILHRPVLNRILVLDEPFKFVSSEYRPNVRTMLEQLSSDLKIQIVMVTHIEELETGKVIEL